MWVYLLNLNCKLEVFLFFLKLNKKAKMGGKHINGSARAKWWDYSDSGTYFITICTKDKVPYFGEVVHDNIKLNEVGEIVSEEWLKTKGLRPGMKIELHEFIVMPDHFHALITIGVNAFNGKDSFLNEYGFFKNNEFKPQSNNLGSIVRGFKSAVTTRCKKNKLSFCWQPRYHDVIIKTPEQFGNVRRYILENPRRHAMRRVPS